MWKAVYVTPFKLVPYVKTNNKLIKSLYDVPLWDDNRFWPKIMFEQLY